MNILSLLDHLEDQLENSASVPFTGKVLVDPDKCAEIIKDIRLNLPDEMKQAELIRRERQRILVDAQKEAEAIVAEAENRIKTMVDENEITRMAYQQAQEIVAGAQKNAKEIRLGAKEYADEVLQKLEKHLENNTAVIRQNRQELRGSQR